jgi:Flp pilus assembly protein TadG
MKLKNTQKGAAMVEFAIVLPLFLVLVFGMIEFSLMLYDKALITNASREAARSGIALRQPTLPLGSLTDNVNTSLQGLTNLTICHYLGANSRITCPNSTNLLISFGTNNPATPTAVYIPATPIQSGTTIVRVTVNYTYNMLVFGRLINLLSNGSFSSSIVLSSTSNMILE